MEETNYDYEIEKHYHPENFAEVGQDEDDVWDRMQLEEIEE